MLSGYMMGVKYIQSILMTPHKNWVSLKKTIVVANSNPTPKAKSTKQPNPNGNISSAGRIAVPVNSITKNNGIKESKRLTQEDSTLDSGYMYLGT